MFLVGGAGNDVIEGGAGADTLDGGRGSDTLVYANSPEAVVVNLATGAGAQGDAEGDTYAAVENVVGTRYADRLTGDAGANQLDGGRGADWMAGADCEQPGCAYCGWDRVQANPYTDLSAPRRRYIRLSRHCSFEVSGRGAT